jgi:hypothetical protein
VTSWPAISEPPASSHLRQIVAIVAILGVLGYGAAVALGITRIPINLIETSIAISTSLDGRILTISGTTTLPDGAVVDCETWHESEDDGLGSGEYHTVDVVTIHSGALMCRADLTGWPTGTVRASARFLPWDQPAAIVDRYGYRGERLSGSEVYQDSDGWVLEVRENVSVTG